MRVPTLKSCLYKHLGLKKQGQLLALAFLWGRIWTNSLLSDLLQGQRIGMLHSISDAILIIQQINTFLFSSDW